MHASAGPTGAAARLGDGGAGQHVDGGHRPGDVGQPHAARLHRRLGRDPAQPVELPRGPLAVPADDGALGVEEHEVRHADLGALLHQPLETFALRRGDGDGDRPRRVAHRDVAVGIEPVRTSAGTDATRRHRRSP